MNKFKIGDSVECIFAEEYQGRCLTTGAVYEVTEVGGELVYVVNDVGSHVAYYTHRFALYPPALQQENTIQQTTPEQHVKEFLKKLEYVLDKDNTTFGRIECWQHQQGVIVLPSDIADIMGVDDIYTYINNSYDQLTSQAAQKRKLELLDKKAKLDVELAEIEKELEGL